MCGIRPGPQTSSRRQSQIEDCAGNTPALFNKGTAAWLWSLYGIGYPPAPRQSPEETPCEPQLTLGRLMSASGSASVRLTQV